MEATIDDAPRRATWDSVFTVERAEDESDGAAEWLSSARRARRLKGGVRTS